MKSVTCVLPYVGNQFLLQLRDFKGGIVYPGMWGFFGGSIFLNEEPRDSAFREIEEEIGLQPPFLYFLGRFTIADLHDVESYTYFFPLSKNLSSLVLNEGADFGLFSVDKIRTFSLYSQKYGKNFPVVPSEYVSAVLGQCQTLIRNGIPKQLIVRPKKMGSNTGKGV